MEIYATQMNDSPACEKIGPEENKDDGAGNIDDRKRKGEDPNDGTEKKRRLSLTLDSIKTTRALLEEQAGEVQFKVIDNDGSHDALILLTGLKNIFQKQLPNMPKEYIARLVYDKYFCSILIFRNHQSLAVVKRKYHVMGGITYRAFTDRDFAEIVFCAISSTEQVQVF